MTPLPRLRASGFRPHWSMLPVAWATGIGVVALGLIGLAIALAGAIGRHL